MRFAGLVVVTLVACAPEPPPPATPRTVASSAPPAPSPSPAPTPIVAPPTPTAASACPATFLLAQSSTCGTKGEDEAGPTCAYDEGKCACGPRAQCGGAKMNPFLGQWWCEPKSPSYLRQDGCLFVQPKAGSACKTKGQVCEYGPCSYNRVIATCNGTWSLKQIKLGLPP